MSTQHLSDEAVAAFADGVLRGHARERAGRHTASCPECANAVTVQREAVLALRTAPPPPMPTALLDRLRSVPSTTPLTAPPFPTVMTQDGQTMFAAFGTSMGPVAPMPRMGRMAPMAALVPQPAARPRSSRLRPVAVTAATVVAAGALAVGSVAPASGTSAPQSHPVNVNVAPVYLSGP